MSTRPAQIRPQRGAHQPSMPLAVPENMPQRLLLLACGFVAFFTIPMPLFALLAAVVGYLGGAPLDLGGAFGLVKLGAVLLVGGAALAGALRINKQLKIETARAVKAAALQEERMRRAGTLGVHAARVAGPARVLGTSARDDEPTAPSRPAQRTSSEAQRSPTPAPHLAKTAAEAEVRCTWCGAVVSAALADAATGDVVCPQCSTRFSMRDALQTRMGNRPQPMGLQVEEVRSTLFITHPTGAGAGCGVFVLGGIAVALTLPDSLNRRDWTVTGVVTALAVGAYVVARVFAARKTDYVIDGDTVAVRVHGFMGGSLGTWTKDEVDQVFVRKHTSTHTSRDSMGRKRKQSTSVYDVILRDSTGRETRLANGLLQSEWALYIEQEIENRLGVVDRVMGKGPSR